MTQAVREAKDYSADERRQFEEVFRPVAASYRRHRRIGLVWFFVAMGCGLLGALFDVLLDRPILQWTAIPFFVCVGVWFCILMTTPRLFCPACSRDLELGFGDYCPECG